MLVTEIIVPFLFVLITVGFCTLCTCCIKAAGRTRTLGVIMGVPLQTNAESQLRNGMDSDMNSAFPIVAFSEIKHMKVGKGLLECAICLSEFGDVDSVRLLPKCDHAFHPECIDTWLSSHVTCPVCRISLVGENEKAVQSSESMGAEQAFNQDNNHVAVSIDEAGGRGTHRLITDHAQARSLCSHSRRIGLMSS